MVVGNKFTPSALPDYSKRLNAAAMHSGGCSARVHKEKISRLQMEIDELFPAVLASADKPRPKLQLVNASLAIIRLPFEGVAKMSPLEQAVPAIFVRMRSFARGPI